MADAIATQIYRSGDRIESWDAWETREPGEYFVRKVSGSELGAITDVETYNARVSGSIVDLGAAQFVSEVTRARARVAAKRAHRIVSRRTSPTLDSSKLGA